MRNFQWSIPAFATVTTLLVAGWANATILTFDGTGLSNGQEMLQEYGDNVSALADAFGTYGEAGEGFTENVIVEYGSVLPRFWAADYSDLTNVFYNGGSGNGPLEVTLTADAGYNVVLYDFDLGSWLSDSTVTSVRVINEDDTVVFESLSDTISSDVHSGYDFIAPLVGQTLTISIDQVALGGASDNVGIDNIRFGQMTAPVAPIPEPATMTLLGMGLAALAARARKRQA